MERSPNRNQHMHELWALAFQQTVCEQENILGKLFWVYLKPVTL
jgi:hypothetical protein